MTEDVPHTYTRRVHPNGHRCHLSSRPRALSSASESSSHSNVSEIVASTTWRAWHADVTFLYRLRPAVTRNRELRHGKSIQCHSRARSLGRRFVLVESDPASGVARAAGERRATSTDILRQ